MSNPQLTEPEVKIVDDASDAVDAFLARIGDEIEVKDYDKARELIKKLEAIYETADNQ